MGATYIYFPLFLLKDIKGEMRRGKIRELEGVGGLINNILRGDWKMRYPDDCIWVSVPEKTLTKFLNNHPALNRDIVNEFDGCQLLGYIALKSIIGRQIYKPIKWDFVLSRMAGKSRTSLDLPGHITPYCSRRKRAKLINALKKNWGLHYYAPQREIRVPMFSFSLDEGELKKRKVEKRGSK